MTTNVKISLIIAAYNCEHTLNKCLNSVRQQSLQEIEIICVDDHSNDRTPHILLKHSQFDERVKIITLPHNRQPGAVRNMGLKQACGEYVCFLDADDFFHDFTALSTLYKTATSNKIDVAIFSYKKYYALTHWTSGKIHYKNLEPSKIYTSLADKEAILLSSSIGTAWNKIYRKEFLITHNIRFAENLLYEDVPFFFKTIILAKQIQIINKAFITYRKSSTTIMKIRNIQNAHIIAIYNLVIKFLQKENLYDTFEYAFIYKSFGAFFKKLKDIPWAYKQQYLLELQAMIKNINLTKYESRLGKNLPKFQKLQNISGANKLSLLWFILFS